mmetsp:Transcript_16854/g.32897  ORF Transcript_16854/g.32897 Transcript_16854/m.32897 type:complete len:219 (-) Transcript_16854:154-810(-)
MPQANVEICQRGPEVTHFVRVPSDPPSDNSFYVQARDFCWIFDNHVQQFGPQVVLGLAFVGCEVVVVDQLRQLDSSLVQTPNLLEELNEILFVCGLNFQVSSPHAHRCLGNTGLLGKCKIEWPDPSEVLGDWQSAERIVERVASFGHVMLLLHQKLQVFLPHQGHLVHVHQASFKTVVDFSDSNIGCTQVLDGSHTLSKVLHPQFVTTRKLAQCPFIN